MFRELSGENSKKPKNHCVTLLLSLKQTAEWLLSSYSFNIWNTYGGLSRVCAIFDEILSHRLIEQSPGKYWHFVCRRVRRVNSSPLSLVSELNGTKDNQQDYTTAQSWLQQSLMDRCLSTQLRSLMKNESHVAEHYDEEAFLRNANYTRAMFRYLNAIEQSQPSLLEDFDLNKVLNAPLPDKTPLFAEVALQNSCLTFYDLKDSPQSNHNPCIVNSTFHGLPDKQHAYHKISPKRQKSHHSRHSKKIANRKPETNCRILNDVDTNFDSGTSKCSASESLIKSFDDSTIKSAFDVPLQRSISCPEIFRLCSQVVQKVDSLRKTSAGSVGCLSAECKRVLEESNGDAAAYGTCNAIKVQNDCIESECSDVADLRESVWKAQHSRSKSDDMGVLNGRTLVDEGNISSEIALCSSMPSILPLQEQQPMKSILEGGAVIVPTECFFPRPQPGQTLMSFLSSDFNICAELDRENAHFCISEALISAIEQIKCTETMKMVAEEVESDEEIKKLTQRIRIRRRERLREKVMNTTLLNDRRTDTTTTSQSVSPMSSSHSSDFGTADSIGSEDDNVHDLELSDRNASNLTSMKESGLSLSMASMYSEADIQKGLFSQNCVDVGEKRFEVDQIKEHLSAEAVALSLLKRFSDKQLPKASDLKWLVSEQEAPQQLLPLPDSWPVSPDAIDEEYDLEKTRLRGNFEWAPPRQQIIFIIHPEPKRKDAILKQNYRCAGCGMKIERSYIKKFRYCEYLGKFFCQCCHANNLAYIPGKILWKWDFRQYYVSKFSWKLLEQMQCDPLFNVMDINSKLYRKIRQLDLCRDYRMQLYYVKNFVKTCRNCEPLQKELDQLPQHIYTDPHVYAISDFLKVKSGDLSKLLGSLVCRCIAHVMQCILCQAKGFICEMCNKFDDIIFPFQLAKVCHCDSCGACFHKHCFKAAVCPRCTRIEERRKKLQEQKEVMTSDDDI